MKRFLRTMAWILVLTCLFSTAGAERLEDDILYTFYDDSAFFGDSITRSLAVRVAMMRQEDETLMEGTGFYATGSLTLFDGSRPKVFGSARCFNYRGTEATMYYITAVVQAKKVFILLGMNDPVGIQGDKALGWIEDIMYYMKRDARTEKAEIYFFSVTPVGTEWCRERNRPDYQERLDEYNARLEEKCAELGAGFIQISERLKGTDNHLNPEYSTDARFHLNTEGVDVWLQCMLDYAQEQYDLGLWDPFGGEKPAAKPVATPTDLQAE